MNVEYRNKSNGLAIFSVDISSKSQVVIESANSEVKRRVARLKNISSTSNSNPNSPKMDKKKKNLKRNDPAISDSIMIVRTLSDSIFSMQDSGRNIYRAKRKCSMSKRKMNGLIKEACDSSPYFASNQSCSGLNSVSNTRSESDGKVDVKFGSVSIREYSIEPGDNPGVTRGPPITIEWNHHSELSYDVDLHEEFRQGQRRFRSEFKIPPRERVRMLKDAGFSSKQILKAQKEAAVVRQKRIRTFEMLHAQKIEESFEMIRRGFMKPFRKRSEKIKNTCPIIDKNVHHVESEDKSDMDTSNRKIILDLSEELKDNVDHPDSNNSDKNHSTIGNEKATDSTRSIEIDEIMKNEGNFYLTEYNERKDDQRLLWVRTDENTLDTELLIKAYRDINETDLAMVDIEFPAEKYESSQDSYFCHPACGTFLKSVKHAFYKKH